MNNISDFLYVLFSLGIIPFLLGLAVTGIFDYFAYKNTFYKIKINLLRLLYAYIWGYAVYLILFRILCISWMKSDNVISDIIPKWVGMQVIITVVSVLAIGFIYISNRKRLLFQLHAIRYVKGALIIVVITMFSILCTVPNMYDAVPAEIAMASNRHALLTSVNIADLQIYTASKSDFMYILFTLIGETIKKNGVQICLFYSPFFLYPVICGVYIWIAKTLFHESIGMRIYFYIIVICCYFVLLFAEAYVGLAVFQNIWNDITLMTACWSPLIVSLIVRVINRGGKNRIK